jgi:2-C-methyl-D-erythritol 2,4-cyclodiphosphate synthase
MGDGRTPTGAAESGRHRVGFGYDAHRFGGPGPVIVCGVSIDHVMGVLATSDGDVGSHALCDAVLGAAVLGDLGTHFPSADPQWADVRSIELIETCVSMAADEGFSVVHADVTIVAEHLRIAPQRAIMQTNLASALGLRSDEVSVKATTTDGLGWIGSGEGVAAFAVATLQR